MNQAADWSFPNAATPLGSTAYYSLRFAPDSVRSDLAALYAWHHQIRAILERVRDPGVAQRKLQWWRDEWHRMERGHPSHPLSRRVGAVRERHGLPSAPFHQILDLVEVEQLRPHPIHEDDLMARCEGDLGALFVLAYGCHGSENRAGAYGLGGACALIARIRDSGRLARRGCPPVPLDWLRTEGLTPDRFRDPLHRHRLPPLLARLGSQAALRLDRARQRGHHPRFARIQARLLEALLDEMNRVDFQVTEGRLSLTPLRKLWLAWRCPESSGIADGTL